MAQVMMKQSGIQVIGGVVETDPQKAVTDYLAGTLVSGETSCGGSHSCGQGDCHH